MKISAAPIYFPENDRRTILAAIDEILRSGELTLGRHGKLFEDEFAKLVGVKHTIAVNSGPSSLEIIVRALDVAGKEVAVPTNTFVATGSGGPARWRPRALCRRGPHHPLSGRPAPGGRAHTRYGRGWSSCTSVG